MWEVFHATNGMPVFVTRYRWVAKAVTRIFDWRCGGGHDYARTGEGW